MNILSCSGLEACVLCRGTLFFFVWVGCEPGVLKIALPYPSVRLTNKQVTLATQPHRLVQTYILFVLLGRSLFVYHCIEKLWGICGGTILSREFPEGTENKRNTSIRTSSRRPIFEPGTYRMLIRHILHMLCESCLLHCWWRLFEVFLDVIMCRQV